MIIGKTLIGDQGMHRYRKYGSANQNQDTGLFIRSDTWVGLTWILLFHCRPSSASANGSLAEVVGQLGKMEEQTDQSQPNPYILSYE